ncbi:DUF3987 domain-containing protein [Streptomyces microflavus]|uniref:DUF3987 domain-containing protein n=1 Tax=Streptomyces microflavus TaxID=1919 RepID=UPI0035E25116
MPETEASWPASCSASLGPTWDSAGYASHQPEATANAYDTRLYLLARTLTDIPEAVTIPLTARADAAVEHFEEELETQLRPGQPLSYITDWAGKLVGAAVRIARLLYLADHITTRWGSQPAMTASSEQLPSRRTTPPMPRPSST